MTRAILALTTLASILAASGPASGQGLDDPAAQVAQLEGDLEREASEARAVEATARRDHAQAAMTDAEGALEQARSAAREALSQRDLVAAQRDHLVADRDRLMGKLRSVSAASYARSGSRDDGIIGLQLGGASRHLAGTVTTTKKQLNEANGNLDHAESVVQAASDAVTLNEALTATAQGELETATAVLASANQEVAATGGAAALSLLGPAVFTADELASWASRQPDAQRSRAGADIASLARMYIEEGAAEGIRGDIAFAQAILESGWFTNRGASVFHNYAGIGHCDSCPDGFGFASPRDGIRAQMQALKSYAETSPQWANPLVSARVLGPAGCCQTWRSLDGVWATGTGYSTKIFTIYHRMLTWLTAARAAAS